MVILREDRYVNLYKKNGAKLAFLWVYSDTEGASMSSLSC